MTRRNHRIASAAIAAVLAASCPWAAAQDADDEEGPIIIGQRRQYDRIFLERPQVGLSLVNVYQRDETKTGDTTVKSDQWLFEQSLDFTTRGYVLSPNFFTLSLAGSAGVNENFGSIDDPTGSVSTSGTGAVYEWDVEGTFRPNGESPLTLYSRREQGWVFREFGPALQTTTTDTGAAIELRSRKLPTRFAVSHIESEQSGQQDIEDFSYTRDAFDWHTTYLPTANQTLTWDYTYTSINQDGITSQQYDTHDARLSHELAFDPRRRKTLTSTINYYKQSGDVNVDRFRWDERLRLRHTDDFRTRYDYTYDQTNVGGSDRNRHRASAGFTHQLFDSLITTADIGLQKSDSNGAETFEQFAHIDWAYRKRVPLGTFSANLGLSWSRQESDANVSPIPIIDQPAAFGDALPIVITGTNVDPNTLVITDPSGLILYQEGLDYIVTQFADRIEIDRIVGGRINAGQGVLLDYQLTPLPGATTTSNSLSTGVRYDFQEGPLRGLTLYTRYARATQDIDTDDPSAFVVNEFTDTAYGLEYRIGPLTLGAEHQDHDSTINPFEADRLWARYTQRVMSNTLLGLNASYTSIEYSEPQNELDLYTVSAQIVHRLTQRLSASLTLLYRHEDDSARGQTTGFEEQFELRWRHRQTQLYAVIRNANLDTPDQEQSFQFFQLGLRREF